MARVRVRWKARQLAGSARAGVWARRRAHESHLQILRASAGPLTGIVVAIVVPVLAALPFIPSNFGRGFMVGLSVMASAGTVVALVWVNAGTPARMMGAAAERWTAAQLRPLQRDGWRLVNHFTLKAGSDIDHVLVGPGGVFVSLSVSNGPTWTA